jgi:nitroreductase
MSSNNACSNIESPHLDPTSLEAALRWRYATKSFDATRKIPSAQWNALQESLRLAPSSFGLQPWRFIVVENPRVRAELRAKSWDQSQVVTASHLVVIASRDVVDHAIIDSYIQSLADSRGIAAADLAAYRGMIVGFVDHLNASNTLEAWTAKQSYIALGFLLSSSAVLGIDACPLEGISPADYDSVLGLAGSGFKTRVACALGYRADDDKYASAPKSRFAAEDVFSYVR